MSNNPPSTNSNISGKKRARDEIKDKLETVDVDKDQFITGRQGNNDDYIYEIEKINTNTKMKCIAKFYQNYV